MGRKHGHDDTLLARPELVLRDNLPCNKALKAFEAIIVVSVEYADQRGNPKGNEMHPVDCFKVHITFHVQSTTTENILRKFTDTCTKRTKQNYQQMFEK